MKKFNLALTLLLAPFFLQANIFSDGTVITVGSESMIHQLTYCFSSSVGTHPNDLLTRGECNTWISASRTSERYPGKPAEYDEYDPDSPTKKLYVKGYFCSAINKSDGTTDPCGSYIVAGGMGYWRYTGAERALLSCPPNTYPNYTYEIDNGGGPEPELCASPEQINQVDECNVNSTQEYLSIPVSVSSGCFETDNGSKCKYKSVDFGGGVKAYALDLEGDCYSNTEDDIVGSEQPTPVDANAQCEEWGGTGLICPEDPEDHCSGGSSWDGDAINSCDEGCGEVNGIFSCFDNDADGDGLPDFLDPDIDGDGVPNELDLDSDGDGQDDAIENGGNGPGGSDVSVSVDVNVDLGPVVSKLDEIKSSITQTNTPIITQPTDSAVSFYTTVYEDGLEGIWNDNKPAFEDSEFLQFLDTFRNVPSGGQQANSNMCFNLGAMGNFGCGSLSATDPRIWTAIRIFILVTAGFACRAILFGG